MRSEPHTSTTVASISRTWHMHNVNAPVIVGQPVPLQFGCAALKMLFVHAVYMFFFVQAGMEIVPENVATAPVAGKVTFDTSHVSSPPPTKLLAPLNVDCKLVTFETSQFPKFEFIELAKRKVLDRSVTADVIQESKPHPVNLDAL